MSNVTLAHLTNKEFPDTHFRGNSIVAYLLCKYTDGTAKNYMIVRSSVELDGNPNLKKTLEEGAKELFRVNLLFVKKINTDLDELLERENVDLSRTITLNHFIEDSRLLKMQRKSKSSLDILYMHCDKKLSGYNSNTTRGKDRLKQVRKLIRKKKAIGIAVSEYVKKSFEEYIPIKIHVIRNGADPGIYSSHIPKLFIRKARNELGLDEGIIWLGTAVRPTVIKGVDVLKQIISKLYEDSRYRRYGLIWAISNGEARREVVKWIEHNKSAQKLIGQGRLYLVLDISKYLTFGKVQSYDSYVIKRFEDILEDEGVSNFVKLITVPIHNIIDIYIHPTLREALSLSIVEALLAGKPIVSTNVGGIKEIVSDKVGKLIPVPNQVSNIALKIYQAGNSYWNLKSKELSLYISSVEAIARNILDNVESSLKMEIDEKEIEGYINRKGLSAKIMARKLLELIEKY